MIRDHDTIAAPATAAGGALAVIRISGEEALRICDRIFRGRKPLAAAAGYTVHYGEIVDDGRVLDDVLVTVFRAPRSYTGEDAAEISCHGSQYIVSEILRLLTASGARMAGPGEFTIRAYLAGKLDPSQAEAVADIIASSSRAAHALAANQMRGGYSDALEGLCEKLLELTALLELELDFSEEEDCRLITVRNSGCSLKQEELINLFDSFYRGSNVGLADGSGLGLYISRQLMQKMDGEVFAEIKEDDFCATVVVRKA